ncbi:MAG: S8 family serine peptidase [Anaerolineae bacterium]
MRKTLIVLLTITLQLAHWLGAPLAQARPAAIDSALMIVLDQTPIDQPLDVIVTLRDRADLSHLDQSAVPAALYRHAAATQTDLLTMLYAQSADRVQHITPLWIDNAIALSANRSVILDLAHRADVGRIQLDDVHQMLAPVTHTSAVPSNLTAINVAPVWQRGIMGQGVVVAVLDSGVDLANADLKAKWRGGTNSWFDPYGEHDMPVDLTGHGTQVLGVILGGDDEAGQPIGVAPGAQWIAARIFNDRGRATTSAIHRALQWVLDPDGDPSTPDAPQVLNNSWSFANPGCSSDFDADLRALRAAGILPVFAAGTQQAVSPANLPDAFAIGALENATTLSSDSAHGPTDCQGTTQVYPQLVAPGDSIHTTDHYGVYTTAAGTSLAAAHVSGALALLLSAQPHLSADEQAALLTSTAADLGTAGPDNDFGYGRLDVAALIDRAAPDQTPIGVWGALGGVLIAMFFGIFLTRHRRAAKPLMADFVHIDTRWRDLDS